MNLSEQLSIYIEKMLYQLKVQEQHHTCDNVGFPEMQVIMYLGNQGKGKMTQIADHLMVGLSNLTAIMDKLVKKKLVERSRSEEDRRIVLVSLTEEGCDIYTKNREQKHDMAKQMLDALDEADQEKLVVIMKKIVGKISKEIEKETC